MVLVVVVRRFLDGPPATKARVNVSRPVETRDVRPGKYACSPYGICVFTVLLF